MAHVVIIGGGISGLSTAFYLERFLSESGQKASYTLCEERPRYGGKIVTETCEEFVIEGGPDSYITHKPWAYDLCKELNLERRLIPINVHEKNFFILKNGNLIPFPSGMHLGIPVELQPVLSSPLLSYNGKVELILNWFLPQLACSTDDITLADLIIRNLGKEFLEMISGPILSGIYVANPYQLSVKNSYPMLLCMERNHGSLLRGMAEYKSHLRDSRNGNKVDSPFFSLKGGMSEIVSALINRLSGDLRCNEKVASVSKVDEKYQIAMEGSTSFIKADAVIFATPAYVTAKLLKNIDRKFETWLEKIRFISTATISLGYRRVDIDADVESFGNGFLVPLTEKRQILGCTITSNKFNNRAREGHVLIRVFIGGEGNEAMLDLPDDEISNIAQRELQEILGISAKPQLRKIFRWIKGNPQRDIGHEGILNQVELLGTRHPGLFLTGSSYKGIGIPDCIGNGMETARNVLRYFSETP